MLSPNNNNSPLAVIPGIPNDILIYSISKYKVKKDQTEMSAKKKIFNQKKMVESKTMILLHIPLIRSILCEPIVFSKFFQVAYH